MVALFGGFSGPQSYSRVEVLSRCIKGTTSRPLSARMQQLYTSSSSKPSNSEQPVSHISEFPKPLVHTSLISSLHLSTQTPRFSLLLRIFAPTPANRVPTHGSNISKGPQLQSRPSHLRPMEWMAECTLPRNSRVTSQ